MRLIYNIQKRVLVSRWDGIYKLHKELGLSIESARIIYDEILEEEEWETRKTEHAEFYKYFPLNTLEEVEKVFEEIFICKVHKDFGIPKDQIPKSRKRDDDDDTSYSSSRQSDDDYYRSWLWFSITAGL